MQKNDDFLSISPSHSIYSRHVDSISQISIRRVKSSGCNSRLLFEGEQISLGNTNHCDTASRKTTNNMDNAISSEQTTIKNFSTLLSKDDMENKNVSADQCVSSINISNNCVSKLNNQNIEITGLSKHNPMHIKKLTVRSRYALFYNVCTQKHVTDYGGPLLSLCFSVK